ncbi:hypothetical protein [Baekduia sp. Peel2402]|uniref:hypothetical protein n=1 Tax=Baekduia sp. Peel2402 TaxID=3458296 RepID=UPI00403EC661
MAEPESCGEGDCCGEEVRGDRQVDSGGERRRHDLTGVVDELAADRGAAKLVDENRRADAECRARVEVVDDVAEKRDVGERDVSARRQVLSSGVQKDRDMPVPVAATQDQAEVLESLQHLDDTFELLAYLVRDLDQVQRMARCCG